jgi:hypothetical protein
MSLLGVVCPCVRGKENRPQEKCVNKRYFSWDHSEATKKAVWIQVVEVEGVVGVAAVAVDTAAVVAWIEQATLTCLELQRTR